MVVVGVVVVVDVDVVVNGACVCVGAIVDVVVVVVGSVVVGDAMVGVGAGVVAGVGVGIRRWCCCRGDVSGAWGMVCGCAMMAARVCVIVVLCGVCASLGVACVCVCVHCSDVRETCVRVRGGPRVLVLRVCVC